MTALAAIRNPRRAVPLGARGALSAALLLVAGAPCGVAAAQARRPARPAYHARGVINATPQWAHPAASAPIVRVEPPPAAMAQSGAAPDPRPDPRPARAPQRQPTVAAAPAKPASNGNANRAAQSQQHLEQWMEAHRNMSLADQHRALENERGFRDQTPQQQQSLHNRLNQLNAMPEQQRRRLIEHIEQMEKLTPAQREQYRAAAARLGSLPEDRQAAVVRAFHAAIEMPEPRRQAWMNSAQFHNQFNDSERETLNRLLEVQPAAAQAGLPGFAPRAAAQPPR